MTAVTLLTTAGCHLCEQAEVMLNTLEVQINKIEIGDNDELVERYGTSIPVLKFADKSELNWPFDPQDILRKIQQHPLL